MFSVLKNKTNDLELIKTYLSTLVYKENGNISYDPWLILQNMKLARKIVLRLIETFDFSKIDGVCILANSGIPLGVMLSQAISKPMFFYRRQPWSIEDKPNKPFFIYPIPEEGSNLVLVDSNIGDGTTSGACVSFLENNNINVKSCITPISFIHQAKYHVERNIEYISLVYAEEIIDDLLELFHCETEEKVLQVITKRKEEEVPISGINNKTKKLSFGKKIQTIFSNFFSSKYQFSVIDEDLSSFLKKSFGSEESQFWSVFSKPKDLKEACLKISKATGIDEYDIFFGTGFFGTIFAIMLAWYSNSDKKIYSTYLLAGWDTLNEQADANNKYIIISGRLRTGIIIKRLLLDLEKINITTEAVVAIRHINYKPKIFTIQCLNELKSKLNNRLLICS